MNKKALYKLGYGVYVVTSRKGESINGQIANAIFQVTSEPLQVAVSINKSNLTHEYIKESRVLAISVLSQDTPLSFIGQFGFHTGRDTNKFDGINYKIGDTGAPIVLDNTTAYMEVKVKDEMDAGTHTIFLGEVVNADVINDDVCMTYDYYHQIKGGKTPKAAATYVDDEPVARRDTTSGMVKYKCKVCGYVYDPDKGDTSGNIKPGTPFEDLPDNWICPVCGAAKAEFEKID